MDSTICSTSPESAATGAQFPVPVGANDLPELQSAGARLAFAVTADRKLVTANKGQLENDQFQGFWICERCGRAALEQPADAPHDRPYSIEYSFSLPRPPRHCDGTFQNVFLGHVFATDLLLLRLTLSPDMATDTNSLVVLRALDGLYSIAEALRLAASRHPQLDLDPSEFGAGFRIVPSPHAGDSLYLDVYLYDTRSGGAGYAELAGQHLNEILTDVLALLEGCPAACERSCESCLSHYHNQHLRDRLDRFVGAQLLRYAISGQVPEEASARDQAANLEGLARLLRLDGFHCTSLEEVDGVTLPLFVERGGESLAVGLQSGLLGAGWEGHSLTRLNRSYRRRVLNEYILRRNLPDEHQFVRSMFRL